MSKSINRVTLLGHVGQEPSVRTTSGGKTVASFTMATNESWKDGSGAWQERTEWHRIVAWGGAAETANKMLAKGRMVYVEGRIQTRVWTNRDGEEQKSFEIVAITIIPCSGEQQKPQPESGYVPDPSLAPVGGDDDLPF